MNNRTKYTASNSTRRLRLLLTGIRDRTIIPRPDFQRRLVWTNKDKKNFLETVLKGYPFPEIYVAAGEVDPQTGRGTEWLVDGQQRISTLYQYFDGGKDSALGEGLKLGKDLEPYATLSKEEQIAFLEYEVVVRDLGNIPIDEIKRIFERINATSYSLNAMEIHNARFDGEFKKFAEDIAQHSFFSNANHPIFSANEIRRMRDISFVLIFIITIMSAYFNREDELESYLDRYNDEFEMADSLRHDILPVLRFIEACNFDQRSRAWKKSDLLTLLVELYHLLVKQGLKLDPQEVGERLKAFYAKVDSYNNLYAENLFAEDMRIIGEYSKASSQATNDRGSRIKRGETIQKVILGKI